MNDYRNYIIENFLTDVLFREWVLDNDQKAEAFWQLWLADNPDRFEIVQEARAILLTIAPKKQTLSDEELEGIVETTLGRLKKEEVASKPVGRRMYLLAAKLAAAVLLAGGLAWVASNYSGSVSSDAVSVAPSTGKERIERINDTGKPMTVLLSDKSTVILQPGSRIWFNPALEKDANRVVHLDGEAFFDVMKDPSHPFLVITNKVITRVLGTSFRVVAYGRRKEASVSVVTGRVTVFTKKDSEKMDEMSALPKSGEVVLSPNEQATYDHSDASLTKSRIQGVANLYRPPRFLFDDTPVTEVFSALEKAYGIEIKYDPEKMDGYLLTATFSDMSLHDELHLICRIIKGTYHIEDGKVIIETDQ